MKVSGGCCPLLWVEEGLGQRQGAGSGDDCSVLGESDALRVDGGHGGGRSVWNLDTYGQWG